MTGLMGKGKGIGIILCIVLAMVMMVGLGINGLAYAAAEVKVTVNGKLVQFPDQKPYIDANSRTLVPMRAPMEAMGVKVDWDADNRQAILDNNNTKVVFTIDQKVYQANGKNRTMDTQAIIVSGRTCIPIRYAAEAFGATVSWDAPNRTAVITTTRVAKEAVIDTSQYKELTQLKDSFPEFYNVEAKSGGAFFESNSKHRFVCTNHPELNEYKAKSIDGIDYIERNDGLTNLFSISYGQCDGKLKKGMALEYDVFDAAGNKIYDLTLQF